MGKKTWLGLAVGAAIGAAPGVSVSADNVIARPARPQAARRYHQPLPAERLTAARSESAVKTSAGEVAFKATLQATRFAEAEKLAANSPILGGAVIGRDRKPRGSALRLPLSEARFAETQVITSNSPIVDGAAMTASPVVR
jgi:hypothetical protein